MPRNPLVWCCVLAVRAYQRLISPALPPTCRYIPTCSHYAIEAYTTHGALRGTWLTARRICRCHPWGGFGWDPVPDKVTKKPKK